MAIPLPKFIADMPASNEGYDHLTPVDTGDEEKEKLLESGVSPTGYAPSALFQIQGQVYDWDAA